MYISISMRDQQDLEIQGHKILKLSDIDYKINGVYIEVKKNTRMSNRGLSKMNRQILERTR